MDTDPNKIEVAQAGDNDPATNIAVDNTAKMDDDDDEDAFADGGDDVDDQPIMQLRDPNERPVYKLSVKLLDTYKFINKVYKS